MAKHTLKILRCMHEMVNVIPHSYQNHIIHIIHIFYIGYKLWVFEAVIEIKKFLVKIFTVFQGKRPRWSFFSGPCSATLLKIALYCWQISFFFFCFVLLSFFKGILYQNIVVNYSEQLCVFNMSHTRLE